MLTIKGGEITLTQGDTMDLKVILTDGSGNPIEYTADDRVLFGIKVEDSGGTPIYQSEHSIETEVTQEGSQTVVYIPLAHEESKRIPVGIWKYDLRYVGVSRVVVISTELSKFIVKEAVAVVK